MNVLDVKHKNTITVNLKSYRFGVSGFFFFVILLIITSCEKKEDTKIKPGLEIEVHALVNEYRKSIGLDTLVFNQISTELCREHSENMAKEKYEVSHEGFEDRFEVIKEEMGAIMAAENVAVGYKSASNVVEAWLKSEGHKNNIEGDFTHTGVGIVANAEDINYFTQIFYK